MVPNIMGWLEWYLVLWGGWSGTSSYELVGVVPRLMGWLEWYPMLISGEV